MEEDYMEIEGIKVKGYGWGSTDDSIKFAKKNIKHVGKLKLFVHDNRITNIMGEKGKIILTGIGMTSGTAFRGFKEILELLKITNENYEEGKEIIKQNNNSFKGRFIHFFS